MISLNRKLSWVCSGVAIFFFSIWLFPIPVLRPALVDGIISLTVWFGEGYYNYNRAILLAVLTIIVPLIFSVLFSCMAKQESKENYDKQEN